MVMKRKKFCIDRRKTCGNKKKTLEKREMMQKVADDYSIQQVTVRDRKKMEIQKWCLSRVMQGALKERKIIKKCV